MSNDNSGNSNASGAAPSAQPSATPPSASRALGGGDPAPIGHGSASIGGGLSESQARVLYQDLIDKGVMTEQQANYEIAAQLRGRSLDPQHDPVVLAADFYPPANPTDYQMPRIEGYETDPAAQQLDGQLRTWLAGAGVPRELGSTLLQAIDKAPDNLPEMDPGARQLYQRESEAALQRLWRNRYPQQMANAQRGVQAIESANPGFAQFIEETGLGDVVEVIVRLAQFGEIVKMRRGEA